MAVAFDAATANGTVLVSTNPVSYSHGGSASLANGAIFVFVGCRANSTTFTATYNGVAMTLVGSGTSASASTITAFHIAASAGNQVVSVANTGASNIIVYSLSLTGANQAPSWVLNTNFATAGGNTATSSIATLTTPANGILVSGYMSQTNRITPTYNGTADKANNGAAPVAWMSGAGHQTGSTSTWSWDGVAVQNAQIALTIAQASAGTTVTPSTLGLMGVG